MANEKEAGLLEDIVTRMDAAQKALVGVFPNASVILKYMAEDLKPLIADLKGRDSLTESQKRQRVRSSEELPGITRPFTSEEMTTAQQKIFGVGR